MNKNNFEGTLVLEQLARMDNVDEFMSAVDAQDADRATQIMKNAAVNDSTIAIVLKKMADPYDEH